MVDLIDPFPFTHAVLYSFTMTTVRGGPAHPPILHMKEDKDEDKEEEEEEEEEEGEEEGRMGT